MDRVFILAINATYYDKDRLLTNHQGHHVNSIIAYGTENSDPHGVVTGLHFSGTSSSLASVRQITWCNDHILELDCDVSFLMARCQAINSLIFSRVINPEDGLQDLLLSSASKTVNWHTDGILAHGGVLRERIPIDTQWNKHQDGRWILFSISFDVSKKIWNEEMEIVCQRVDIMLATDKRKLMKL